MPDDDRFNRLRTHLLGNRSWDAAFDQLLPPLAWSKAHEYWSPLSVARGAASLFAERGVRRVLDVGSGPGKFCIAAAFARPDLQFWGVEQDDELVQTAMDLASRLRLRNVTFVTGDALSIDWSRFDGFYFFNPFVENPIRCDAVFDEAAGPAGCSGDVELLRIARRLSSLRTGSLVLTYHGIGGPLPSSYDLVLEQPAGTGCLRAWAKNRSHEADWYHLDVHGEVSRAPQLQVERALRRFALRADVTPHPQSSVRGDPGTTLPCTGESVTVARTPRCT